MKTKILPIALLAFATANAQPSEKAFALTDANKGGLSWNQIRQVNLKNGEATELVVSANKQTPAYQPGNAPLTNTTTNSAAALAFDKNNNRLYFASMFVNGMIQSIDLNNPSHPAKAIAFAQTPNVADPEATNLTRMVVAADGFLYAITNDANTFIRFGTGKKAVVENLGGLIDDEKNGAVSIHNRCSSWGGDMIADAYGKLYVFTLRGNIFMIDPISRIATYLGHAEGLPADFTCNGAAVNADGKIVVSGAAYTKGYFTIDLPTLKAQPLANNADVYNASDLATSNLYLQAQVDNSLKSIATIAPKEMSNDKISVYPNPVTDGRIVIAFDVAATGNYTIELADLTGKTINKKQVSITGEGQTTTLNADRKIAKGLYFVKVTDSNKKQIFSSRILVQ